MCSYSFPKITSIANSGVSFHFARYYKALLLFVISLCLQFCLCLSYQHISYIYREIATISLSPTDKPQYIHKQSRYIPKIRAEHSARVLKGGTVLDAAANWKPQTIYTHTLAWDNIVVFATVIFAEKAFLFLLRTSDDGEDGDVTLGPPNHFHCVRGLPEVSQLGLAWTIS